MDDVNFMVLVFMVGRDVEQVDSGKKIYITI